MEELVSDAEEILEKLVEDDQLKEVYLQLVSNPCETVQKSLNTLYEADTEKAQGDVCFIIALLTQWLVRYTTRRIMQLLTPEGLVLHHNKLPRSYVVSYMQHQEHFSFKETIENQKKMLTTNKW